MLEDWLDSYRVECNSETSDLLRQRLSEAQTSSQRIDSQISQENRKLQKAYDLLESDVYTTDEFTARRASIQERIAELTQKKSQIEKKISEYEQAVEQQEDIVPAVERLVMMYKYADTAREKNDMLKACLERIEYKKTKQYNDSSIKLWIYPRLGRKS